jgi:hypothetical protein
MRGLHPELFLEPVDQSAHLSLNMDEGQLCLSESLSTYSGACLFPVPAQHQPMAVDPPRTILRP